MKETVFWTILFLGALFVSACSYRKEKGSDFFVSYNSALLEKVSYQMVNQKIFVPKCISCHGTSGDINLETYSEVTSHLEKIKKATLSSHKMPKSPYPGLSRSELELLATWIYAGAPEKALDGTDIPPPTVEPLVPTFSSIKKNIFESKCLVCHSAGKEVERIPLDTADEMINSPLEIVIPGNPDESGLILSVLLDARKIMPPKKSGLSMLKPSEIEIIKQWIANGAKD